MKRPAICEEAHPSSELAASLQTRAGTCRRRTGDFLDPGRVDDIDKRTSVVA